VEAFKQSSSVHACLLTFWAAFTKMVITPTSEVEMMCLLLGWNLESKELPTTYGQNPISSQDGIDLDGKSVLLSRNAQFCVCNHSQLGQQS
jgi:hypothetical protein